MPSQTPPPTDLPQPSATDTTTAHDGAAPELAVTDRTRITRMPERQRTDRTELYGILDDALVAMFVSASFALVSLALVFTLPKRVSLH